MPSAAYAVSIVVTKYALFLRLSSHERSELFDGKAMKYVAENAGSPGHAQSEPTFEAEELFAALCAQQDAFHSLAEQVQEKRLRALLDCYHVFGNRLKVADALDASQKETTLHVTQRKVPKC